MFFQLTLRRLYGNCVSWSLSRKCINNRIKSRKLNCFGVLDSLDDEIDSFQYCFTAQYVQQRHLKLLADNNSNNCLGFLTAEDYMEAVRELPVRMLELCF